MSDLISREALKENIKNAFKHNFNGYDAILVNEIYEFIDHAPSVEPKLSTVFAEDASEQEIQDFKGEVYMTGEDYNLYMEGYKAGKKDFEPKQGEWICHSDNYITFYTCNRCNGFGYKDDKFCNNCGAKMQKGGAE